MSGRGGARQVLTLCTHCHRLGRLVRPRSTCTLQRCCFCCAHGSLLPTSTYHLASDRCRRRQGALAFADHRDRREGGRQLPGERFENLNSKACAKLYHQPRAAPACSRACSLFELIRWIRHSGCVSLANSPWRTHARPRRLPFQIGVRYGWRLGNINDGADTRVETRGEWWASAAAHLYCISSPIVYVGSASPALPGMTLA